MVKLSNSHLYPKSHAEQRDNFCYTKSDEIEINHYDLLLPKLPKVFSGYQLAHISDLHYDGKTMTGEKLARLSEIINHQKPDSIAMTGDYISTSRVEIYQVLHRFFRMLIPKDHVFAVMGNHDHWNNPRVVERAMHDAGIIHLNNQVFTIKRGSSQLQVSGLDSYMEKKSQMEFIIPKLNGSSPSILLVHEPDFADISADSGYFDLQLSGHSHGGQVVLPLIGPPFLPAYARKYPNGFYKVKDMLLFTNRGLGTIHIKFRFNCNPEIAMFTFHS